MTQEIGQVIDTASAQFVETITQYKWDLVPDSQLYAAKQALTRSKYITDIACSNPEAVNTALVNAAILGLDLTEGKRQGWLLPRKNQHGKTVIVLQVGYKGVEAIHQRMGVIDRLVIRVVRANDEFSWSGDDQEKPDHKAEWFQSDKDRGEAVGVYSITYFPNGSIHVMTTAITEIFEKHRDRSDSWKTYARKKKEGGYNHPPPWVSDERSMIEKTMAFIAAKQWPANIRNAEISSKILETLHDTDVSDYQFAYSEEQETAFFSLFDKSDGLGLHLFQQRVSTEAYVALCFKMKKAFPKGEKIKRMEVYGGLCELGRDTYNEIIRAIMSDDNGLLMENIEDISPITEKLLIWHMGEKIAEDYANLKGE